MTDFNRNENAMTFHWEVISNNLPESLEIHAFINSQLERIYRVEEDAVLEGVKAFLRANGYTIHEPGESCE